MNDFRCRDREQQKAISRVTTDTKNKNKNKKTKINPIETYAIHWKDLERIPLNNETLTFNELATGTESKTNTHKNVTRSKSNLENIWSMCVVGIDQPKQKRKWTHHISSRHTWHANLFHFSLFFTAVRSSMESLCKWYTEFAYGLSNLAMRKAYIEFFHGKTKILLLSPLQH